MEKAALRKKDKNPELMESTKGLNTGDSDNDGS